MNRLALAWALAMSALPTGARPQLSPPNGTGVAMGHLHYRVEDLEASLRFWVGLGGDPLRLGEIDAVKFPGVLVLLEASGPRPGTAGSVVDHVAFRVRSLDEIEAAGFDVERLEDFPGVASVYAPGGERIELFDETAENLTFTAANGIEDPVAERHNRPIRSSIVSHHIHLYLPEGAELEAREWYSRIFGGTPGMRWRYPASDLPGINFNFSVSPEARAPLRGRVLDHIGLEVRDLEAFCRRLESLGVELDVPYTRNSSGIASAFLTDPWGTYIELTEGLNGL